MLSSLKSLVQNNLDSPRQFLLKECAIVMSAGDPIFHDHYSRVFPTISSLGIVSHAHTELLMCLALS